MSFFKKIKKVLALLSPWAQPSRPRKQKRGPKRPSRSRVRRISPKAPRRTAQKLPKDVSRKRTSRPLKKQASSQIKETKKIITVSAKKAKPALPKKTIQKPLKKASVKSVPAASAKMPAVKKTEKLKRVLVGEVTHYFDKVHAAAFMITGAPIRLGEALEFEGKSGTFRQEIKSLQIDRVPVKSAQAGDEVGLLVKKPVREGDYVFKVTG